MSYPRGQVVAVLRTLVGTATRKPPDPIPATTRFTLDGEPLYIIGYVRDGGFLVLGRKDVGWTGSYESGWNAVHAIFLGEPEFPTTRFTLLTLGDEGRVTKTHASGCAFVD